MHRAEHPEIMWGLGLDPDTAACIEEHAGSGFTLRNLPTDASAWMRGSKESSQMAWIPQAVWDELPKSRQAACRGAEGLRRILILDAQAESPETEAVLAQGFTTAVRAPLSRYAVRDAILRLREMDSLAADLRRRTDEVLLEREMLARKSSHLSFLNRMLSRASASLDAATILSKARTDLGHLLPVEVFCAVFWARRESGTGLEAEMHMHQPMPPAENTAWAEILLAAAERLGGDAVSDYRQSCLNPGKLLRGTPPPGSGRLLMLPLAVGGESFGCLALMTHKGLRLAKDEVRTLNAAVNHLALALRNALLFRQMKSMADHDGLTKIANRRRFDERLEEEVLRHGRYGQPFSLILFDLDHFKSVNDRHGHQAGDKVLRGMAGLLHESLRASDLPARFGGEEFAVILPHTAREKAVQLAERIRQRVEAHDFEGLPADCRVTVSAGVASLQDGLRPQELVALADQALYLAKNGGRNRVLAAESQTGVQRPPRAKDAAATAPARRAAAGI